MQILLVTPRLLVVCRYCIRSNNNVKSPEYFAESAVNRPSNLSPHLGMGTAFHFKILVQTITPTSIAILWIYNLISPIPWSWILLIIVVISRKCLECSVWLVLTHTIQLNSHHKVINQYASKLISASVGDATNSYSFNTQQRCHISDFAWHFDTSLAYRMNNKVYSPLSQIVICSA